MRDRDNRDYCYSMHYEDGNSECEYCFEKSSCRTETINNEASRPLLKKSKKAKGAGSVYDTHPCYGTYEEGHRECVKCAKRSSCKISAWGGNSGATDIDRTNHNHPREIPPLLEAVESRPFKEVMIEVAIRSIERAISAAAREVSDYFLTRRFKVAKTKNITPKK
ncbi:hypothetical protein LCGC14_0147170 [marine sediment metagenome]|uniref:Uncharacterized protein n=1 Tax=marine sediment metagenome TaxID=412755 RepID=A0A0F9V057_9ZZZZ